MSATAWLRLRGELGLRGFLRWWGAGLLAWLPARWRMLLTRGDDRLLLSPQGDAWVLQLQRQGEIGELARLPLPLQAEHDEVAALLRAQASQLPRWLLLPAAAGLRRRLLLPAAAAGRLHAVLGFEIERQTPFAAEAVLHAGRVLQVRADGQLEAELVVLPKRQFDAATTALGGSAAQLAGVALADAEGQALPGINLLPATQRSGQRNPWRGWNLGLAVLALLALALGMAQLLDNRRAAADALESSMQGRESRARAASSQRQQLLAALEGEAWLRAQRSSRPSAVEIMDALAQRLPDDTHLEKLAIDGSQLTLIGVSNRAAALVGKLEGAPQWRAPALSGALQQDPRTRQDRFTLIAQLMDGAAPAVNAGAAR